METNNSKNQYFKSPKGVLEYGHRGNGFVLISIITQKLSCNKNLLTSNFKFVIISTIYYH